MRQSLVLVLLCACDAGSTPDTDANPDDTDTSTLPAPAPLATPTGACPDFNEQGEFEIESNGQTRRGEIYWPNNPDPGLSLLFTWHGLSDGSIDVVGLFVSGFDLEELARQKNAVIVVPEATSQSLAGMSVQLWGILGNEEDDLALYDDLRACISQKFDINQRKVVSWGFSGGALWTSYLLMHRSDTLATGAALSGGTDLEIPLLGDQLEFQAPTWDIPVLLSSGGTNDVWPSTAFKIIDFEESSDNFQDKLRAAGSYVARCTHSRGHDVPDEVWTQAKKWLFQHTYGAASPYADGTETLSDGCTDE